MPDSAKKRDLIIVASTLEEAFKCLQEEQDDPFYSVSDALQIDKAWLEDDETFVVEGHDMHGRIIRMVVSIATITLSQEG